jgi:predicted RNA polymerase sigma factor
MPNSFDVFISYKREDQAFADLLPERLDTLPAIIYLIFNESMHGEQESASRRGSNLSREQIPWKPTERSVSILAHN